MVKKRICIVLSLITSLLVMEAQASRYSYIAPYLLGMTGTAGLAAALAYYRPECLPSVPWSGLTSGLTLGFAASTRKNGSPYTYMLTGLLAGGAFELMLRYLASLDQQRKLMQQQVDQREENERIQAARHGLLNTAQNTQGSFLDKKRYILNELNRPGNAFNLSNQATLIDHAYNMAQIEAIMEGTLSQQDEKILRGNDFEHYWQRFKGLMRPENNLTSKEKRDEFLLFLTDTVLKDDEAKKHESYMNVDRFFKRLSHRMTDVFLEQLLERVLNDPAITTAQDVLTKVAQDLNENPDTKSSLLGPL